MHTTNKLLKSLRAHLTQREISRRTGIPQPRLSQWEKKVPKSADDALKLAELAKEVLPAITENTPALGAGAPNA